jgi:tRNA (guanine37-N1)-methyltransferase
MVLIAGRYEGIDERVMELAVDQELSIGDYVVSGGELPALVLIDALARLLPGALGDERSSVDESFGDGLLDWPHYTRPELYQGRQGAGGAELRRPCRDPALAQHPERGPHLDATAGIDWPRAAGCGAHWPVGGIFAAAARQRGRDLRRRR